MRIVVLVDGEHYPPAVRATIGRLRARGDDVVAAVFLGGSEKLKPGSEYGIALETGERMATLARVLDRHAVDAVVDLSDEPVVTPQDRFDLARIALSRGVRYTGADFDLRPPPLERIVTKPCVRVIATGKRTGKTAVAGAFARHARSKGRTPVIVAMGRGGPERPVVIEAGTRLGARELLAIADEGLHAASDYLEDAVTSNVTTIGCRRVGGGLAGAVFESNVAEGARMAQARDEDLVILEGSGSAIPPVAARAGLVCVPAGATVDTFLTPLRLLLADVAVVTMAEDKAPAALTENTIRGLVSRIEVVRAVFRPSPLGTVGGRRVFFCTTAPTASGERLKRHLEKVHGCVVTGMSHALADRVSLETDLGNAGTYDVLLTEVKGAAVDVAVRRAMRSGTEVVFADNELVGEGVGDAFDHLLGLASFE